MTTQDFNPNSAIFYKVQVALAQASAAAAAAANAPQLLIAKAVQANGFPNTILPGYQPNLTFTVPIVMPGDFVLWQGSFGALPAGLWVTSVYVPAPGILILAIQNDNTDPGGTLLDQPFDFLLVRGNPTLV